MKWLKKMWKWWNWWQIKISSGKYASFQIRSVNWRAWDGSGYLLSYPLNSYPLMPWMSTLDERPLSINWVTQKKSKNGAKLLSRFTRGYLFWVAIVCPERLWKKGGWIAFSQWDLRTTGCTCQASSWYLRPFWNFFACKTSLKQWQMIIMYTSNIFQSDQNIWRWMMKDAELEFLYLACHVDRLQTRFVGSSSIVAVWTPRAFVPNPHRLTVPLELLCRSWFIHVMFLPPCSLNYLIKSSCSLFKHRKTSEITHSQAADASVQAEQRASSDPKPQTSLRPHGEVVPAL